MNNASTKRVKLPSSKHYSSVVDLSEQPLCAFCDIRIALSEEHVRSASKVYHLRCYAKERTMSPVPAQVMR